VENQPTVFVVDDDPAINQAVTDLVEVIGLKASTYTSAIDFLEDFKPSGPACLVLDIRMPGMSGLELQKKLAAAESKVPVVVITGHGDIRMAVEAMKLGAIEFLEKPFRAQELCDSIQKAIRLDEENWRLRQRQQQADQTYARLTPAERQVMDLVVAGKTNKMIAEQLGLSVRAVEDRRARMMKKLGVESRAELLELARSPAVP
jgi:RNA polymerase sigma factor (sigma-70 family)